MVVSGEKAGVETEKRQIVSRSNGKTLFRASCSRKADELEGGAKAGESRCLGVIQ
jgi:hypothetical protein